MDRRAFLTVSGISLLTSATVQATTDSSSSVEGQLRTLKQHLSDTDLDDPQATASVHSQFTQTLSAAQANLEETYAQATERADTLYAGGNVAGAAPTQTATRSLLTQPFARYKTAINYYRTVSQYLASSLPVRDRVAQTSRRIQDLPAADPQPTTDSFNGMKTQLDQLERITTTLQNDAQDILTLLPDIDSILQQTERQLEFYTEYTRSQQAYLDARDAIVQGTANYENEAYADARSRFDSAGDDAAINIAGAIRSYSPTQDTASLGRFSDTLQSIRQACTKMRAASRPENTPKMFSEGRNELINADQILYEAEGSER